MEDHPRLDFGSPGALVHYAERFLGCGYEELLLASVARRPTGHTIWMLNRLRNGTRDGPLHARIVDAIRAAAWSQAVDPEVRAIAEGFLEYPSTDRDP
jgi:hypothetical protein